MNDERKRDKRVRDEDVEIKDGAAQDPRPPEPTVDPGPPEDDE